MQDTALVTLFVFFRCLEGVRRPLNDIDEQKLTVPDQFRQFSGIGYGPVAGPMAIQANYQFCSHFMSLSVVSTTRPTPENTTRFDQS
jgi:hypothetical protein